MLKTRVCDIVGTQVLDDRDILYTRREAAEYLKKSEPTLERWAKLGIGPKPIKLGPRSVRYTLRSLRQTAGEHGGGQT
jgi:predicted DNA-binding transcriptional regulator AlpA